MRVLTMDPIEAAYRTQHQRLWRSLLAYTGDADVATEAAAETYSQAVGRGDQLVDPTAWIWRTAFRVAAGLLADRSDRARPIGVDFDRGFDDGLDNGSAVHDQSLAEFLDQLGGLSEQQRAVVVLRYAGGFTPSEIAQILGSSANSIRVQLHRAHAHLKETMTR